MTGQSAVLSRPREKLRRLWANIQSHPLRWGIGTVLIVLINGYILYRLWAERHAFAEIDWSQLDLRWLGVAFVVQTLGLGIAVLGWQIILRQAGYPLPFRQHFKIYTLALLARRLPGIGWDILGRVYLYRQHGVRELLVSVVAIGELVTLGVAGALVVLLTALLPGTPLPDLPLPLLIGALVLFLGLVPTPLFQRLLLRLSPTGEATLHLRWYHLYLWLGISTGVVLIGGLCLFFLASAFSGPVWVALVPMLQTWGVFMAVGILLIWVPGSQAITLSMLMLVLATMMPTPQALLLLVAWRLWLMLIEITWGLIGLLL